MLGLSVYGASYIFLYGYDVQDKSFGGHSLIKGHENTFPIPVMYKFCNSGARYFQDSDGLCHTYIVDALRRIPLDGKPIIPLRRLGGGCSRLNEMAPLTYQFLQDELAKIAYPNIRWDYNSIYESEY